MGDNGSSGREARWLRWQVGAVRSATLDLGRPGRRDDGRADASAGGSDGRQWATTTTRGDSVERWPWERAVGSGSGSVRPAHGGLARVFFYFFWLKIFTHAVGLGDRMRKSPFCLRLRYPHRKIAIFVDLFTHACPTTACKNRF